MLFVAIAGLIFLPFVLRALRADTTALVLFCLGALTAAIAIGMDTIDPATMPMTVERLEQTIEVPRTGRRRALPRRLRRACAQADRRTRRFRSRLGADAHRG